MVSFGMFSFIAESAQRRAMAEKLVQAAAKQDLYCRIYPRLEDMAKKMPPKVYTLWQHAMKEAYPGIKLGVDDWTTSCLGLLSYFRMEIENAGRAKAGLALPSKSAHTIWKVWQEQEPRLLMQFLKNTMGMDKAPFIGSCPTHATQWAPRALADTWVLAHAMEGIDVRGRNDAEVPVVFAIDKSVRMPQGVAFFRHGLEPLGGFYRLLDEQGNTTQERHGSDVLSELFLYDMPDANTPEEAQRNLTKNKPIISGALSAFRALFSSDALARPKPAPINPPKKKRKRQNALEAANASGAPQNQAPLAIPMFLAASVLASSASSASDSSYESSGDASISSSMDIGNPGGM